MRTIEQSVDVDVDVTTAYNQWTQFEEFPKFMEDVEEVRQLDDTHIHWVADIWGARREWDAEITEQTPDQRIAWRNVDGTHHAGVVTFHKLEPEKTRIMLQLEMDPEGFVEKAGDALGVVERRAKADMERFAEFIESRHTATGAWRGSVEQD